MCCRAALIDRQTDLALGDPDREELGLPAGGTTGKAKLLGKAANYRPAGNALPESDRAGGGGQRPRRFIYKYFLGWNPVPPHPRMINN